MTILNKLITKQVHGCAFYGMCVYTHSTGVEAAQSVARVCEVL